MQVRIYTLKSETFAPQNTFVSFQGTKNTPIFFYKNQTYFW